MSKTFFDIYNLPKMFQKYANEISFGEISSLYVFP